MTVDVEASGPWDKIILYVLMTAGVRRLSKQQRSNTRDLKQSFKTSTNTRRRWPILGTRRRGDEYRRLEERGQGRAIVSIEGCLMARGEMSDVDVLVAGTQTHGA